MPFNLLQKLEGHSDRVWTLAWNPTGTVLASSGSDKAIRLWAKVGKEWACVSILTETHSKSIRKICWSPCGQYIASASFDTTVSIWGRNPIDSSWTTVVNLDGHESEAKSVAWSSDGRYLASCGRDKTVWIWQRAEENEDVEDSAENWDCSDVKNDHTKDVKHVIWHPHHNILVSCSYDDTVKFFHKDGDDWKCYETLTSHRSTVWSADFSPSGEYLVTCSSDKTVRVWINKNHKMLPNVEPNSWKCVSTIQGYHSRTIYDVSWCKDPDVIVSASGDNSLKVYEKSTDDIFTCIDQLSLSHDCDVNTVSWNPKEIGLLASGSDDCSIKLWTYSMPGEGLEPMTIVQDMKSKLEDITRNNGGGIFQLAQAEPNAFIMKLTDHLTLMNLVLTLQCLQDELSHDDSISELEKLLNLKFSGFNQQPVLLTEINHAKDDEFVTSFSVMINDGTDSLVCKVQVTIDEEKIKLYIPRRSSSMIAVANELFVIDKTGNMFKILPDGQSHFLLGHLFSFTGVRFMTNRIGTKILFVISSDRDEKIRISNYPETFKIERFAFGHKYLLKSLAVIDESRFASLDQQNDVCIWNLDDLNESPTKPLRPIKTMQLIENPKKRARRNL